MTNLNAVKVTQKVEIVSMPSEKSPVGYRPHMDCFLGKVGVVLMTDTNRAAAVYVEEENDYFYFMFDNLKVVDETVHVALPHELGATVKVVAVPSEDSFGYNDTMVRAIGSEHQVNEIRVTKSFDQVAFGIQFNGPRLSAAYFEGANLEAVQVAAAA